MVLHTSSRRSSDARAFRNKCEPERGSKPASPRRPEEVSAAAAIEDKKSRGQDRPPKRSISREAPKGRKGGKEGMKASQEQVGTKDLGEWCLGDMERMPFFRYHKLRFWNYLASVFKWKKSREIRELEAYEACMDKRAEFGQNKTLAQQAQYDVLRMENRHLFQM